MYESGFQDGSDSLWPLWGRKLIQKKIQASKWSDGTPEYPLHDSDGYRAIFLWSKTLYEGEG